jgi:hypothetical protein
MNSREYKVYICNYIAQKIAWNLATSAKEKRFTAKWQVGTNTIFKKMILNLKI